MGQVDEGGDDVLHVHLFVDERADDGRRQGVGRLGHVVGDDDAQLRVSPAQIPQQQDAQRPADQQQQRQGQHTQANHVIALLGRLPAGGFDGQQAVGELDAHVKLLTGHERA